MEWLDQVNAFLASANFYFYLAIIGSVFFAVQLVLLLVGVSAGSDVDFDADFDSPDVDLGGSGLSFVSFFSLRSLAAFLTFFGWAGFFWGDQGLGGFAIALGCGLAMMAIATLVAWFFIKMQQSGTLHTADFIGKTGTVYLGLPAGRAPGGQITVVFEDRTRQVKALADEALPTGTPIRILEAIEPGLFLVAKV